MELLSKPTLENDARNYLALWHRFPIDYWWRKKYGIPFGSPQHRAANFFDMLLEYKEELEVVKANTAYEESEVMEFSGGQKLSQSEIDDDYENLDIDNIKI